MYKQVGYSTMTCPHCHGSKRDPDCNPYSKFYIKSLDYCPHCAGQGTVQINHYEEVKG